MSEIVRCPLVIAWSRTDDNELRASLDSQPFTLEMSTKTKNLPKDAIQVCGRSKLRERRSNWDGKRLYSAVEEERSTSDEGDELESMVTDYWRSADNGSKVHDQVCTSTWSLMVQPQSHAVIFGFALIRHA